MRPVTTQEQMIAIAEAVGAHFEVTFDQMVERNRTNQVHTARAFAMLVLHKNRQATFSEIGRLFDRDHSAVSHAIKTIEHQMTYDARMADVWDQINVDSNVSPKRHTYVARGTIEATVSSNAPLDDQQVTERARMCLENGIANVSIDNIQEAVS